MKRVPIAVVLIIIAVIICIYEYIFVTKKTEEFIYRINTLEETYSQSEKSEALILTDEINRRWKNTVSRMDMLLYHDYVDAITNNLSKLSVYIREDQKGGFYTTCIEIRKQLESLGKSEIPNLENII